MCRRQTLIAVVPLVALLLAHGRSGDTVTVVSDVVLATRNTTMWSAWPLRYGQALQITLDMLDKGRHKEALEAAKMYFVLCPDDEASIKTAAGYVAKALTAVDGNNKRAAVFEDFALYGQAGPDNVAGTQDDLVNHLSDIGCDAFVRADDYFARCDSVLDARAAVTSGWDRDWYKSEKAFERLNCARFDEAAKLLVEVLSAQVKVPHAPDEENWELKRIQQIIDRSAAGMGVVYRAKKGTAAGLEDFKRACVAYIGYGPPGVDGVLGTPDDLTAPM